MTASTPENTACPTCEGDWTAMRQAGESYVCPECGLCARPDPTQENTAGPSSAVGNDIDWMPSRTTPETIPTPVDPFGQGRLET